ncbi:MAG: chemotaxis protein CheB [Chitinophagaceae bacterium]|nr:MAG: chemotaxis protein CheB [Chitinophagaceae bacterium]
MDKSTTDEPKFMVVIGTSAGGIRALEELVLQLPVEIDAAFFVVLHLSRKGVGEVIFQRLQQYSTLPCRIAMNGESIERGNIYLAPPDEHMLLSQGKIITGKGAPENRWRPSINNLFRSAAASYNSRVIGIILTGLLDDGTAGMNAIKRAGGLAIVQNPAEADHPDMPTSVLENIEVDYVESLAKMGTLLKEIVDKTEPVEVEVPYDILLETQIDQRVSTRIDDVAQFEKIDINCPDCGGGLYMTQKENPPHYRCHVGHSYTDRELLIRVSEVMENTFWTSLRMMEERRSLLMKLSNKDRERGYDSSAKRHFEMARDMEVHIENLKKILFTASQVD